MLNAAEDGTEAWRAAPQMGDDREYLETKNTQEFETNVNM
jgi:hypothetical protein